MATKRRGIMVLSNKVKGIINQRDGLHLILKMGRRMKRLYPDCMNDRIIAKCFEALADYHKTRMRKDDELG